MLTIQCFVCTLFRSLHKYSRYTEKEGSKMPDILLYVTRIPCGTEKKIFSHACFTHFYGQLLASHVNPGGWIFSPFICPLSVNGFPLSYTIYLRRALPFSVAYTADGIPACSRSGSSFAPLFCRPPACLQHPSAPIAP